MLPGHFIEIVPSNCLQKEMPIAHERMRVAGTIGQIQ
jgi:hypothetical protein